LIFYLDTSSLVKLYVEEVHGSVVKEWFNNVELVVAEKIGQETTTYVRNIYKYYVAHRLTLEAEEAARKAREEVAK